MHNQLINHRQLSMCWRDNKIPFFTKIWFPNWFQLSSNIFTKSYHINKHFSDRHLFSKKHINTKLKAKGQFLIFHDVVIRAGRNFMNENSPGLSTSSQPSFRGWNVFLKNFALGKSLLSNKSDQVQFYQCFTSGLLFILQVKLKINSWV